MERIIRPLYFAAPVSWYSGISDHTELLICDEPFFPQHPEWRNRLRFAGPQGIQQFSIPLQKSSRDAPYSSVEISYAEKWQNRLLHALRTAYGKSPFYEYYDYLVEPVLLRRHRTLWELNTEMLQLTLRCLKIKTVPAILSAACDEELPYRQQALSYYQVFASKNGFIPGLSILDLLFNEGIQAPFLLME